MGITFNKKNLLLLFTNILMVVHVYVQAQTENENSGDSLIRFARAMINTTKTCALISIDSLGVAHVRTMEVFTPEKDFTLWFGTTIKSRKVKEIKNNPKVTIYYADPNNAGYVSIMGTAVIITDALEKTRWWKNEWESYFIDKNDFVLIKVIPQKMEMISYKNGLNGDKKTWKAVNYNLKNK